MTFANRRAWINPEPIAIVLEDDAYREIGLEEVAVGDIAMFFHQKQISHTGVVVGVDRLSGVGAGEVRIMSKWGMMGEYVHLVKEGPYAMHDVTFWTERP